MKAMILETAAPMGEGLDPLRLVDLPDPIAGPNEILIRVAACGVCHTELDEIEGRLVPPRLPVVPGHEVVGRVVASGDQVTRFNAGDRVGVGWIHHSSGDDDENLSTEFRATGCDVNGGYAEYMTVPEAYAVPIPDALSDIETAPLLCAGAIGYRALSLTNLTNGQPLGLMGFGGSAHLVLPVAKHLYPRSPVYIFAREESVHEFAVELGADWAGGIDADPPQPVSGMIDTTPAWHPVVASLQKLAPGGRLVINAIRKEDSDKTALANLNYHEHLWMEREIKSVANITAKDIQEFIPLAAKIGVRPTTTTYRLDDANEALRRLRKGGIKGAGVLVIDSPAAD